MEEDKPFKCGSCNQTFSNHESLKRHQKIHSGDKLFKCILCDYSSARSDHLKLHMCTHAGDKKYICESCSYRTVHKDALRAHFKRVHLKLKPHKCTLCNYRSLRSADVRRHMLTHTGDKPFKCIVCKYQAETPSRLKTHVMKKHSLVKPYKCKYNDCGYSGESLTKLKEHICKHLEKENNIYKCESCDFQNESLSLVKEHVNNHAEITKGDKLNIKCESLEKDTFVEKVDKDMINSDEIICSEENETHFNIHSSSYKKNKKYKCNVCGLTCNNLNNIKQHLNIHNIQNSFSSFKCSFCQFTHALKEQLSLHIKSHILGIDFKCESCDYERKHIHLKTDIKVKEKQETINEENEKYYNCKQCNFICSKKFLLENHLKIHLPNNSNQLPSVINPELYNVDENHTENNPSDENNFDKTLDTSKANEVLLSKINNLIEDNNLKPYKCTLCEQRFSKYESLKRHNYIHSGDKPFKCKLCDYSSARSDHLKSHMISHIQDKKYKCESCNYKTVHKSTLQQHIKRIHVKEKPHKCKFCNFRSVEFHEIRRHMVVHTGDKQFKCDKCNFKTGYRYRLNKHLKVHLNKLQVDNKI